MRELRNIRSARFKKRKTNRRRILLVIFSVVLALAAIFIILRIKQNISSSDLTAGRIYTRQIQPSSSGQLTGEKGLPRSDKEKKDEIIRPEEFTFYKVLSSKEGDITPLSVNKAKIEDGEAKDVGALQSKNISKIDNDIAKKIEKNVGDNLIYTVQVGALSQEAAANEVAGKLRGRGFTPYITRGNNAGRGQLYKIRVGRFQSAADAQEAANILKREGYETYVIKAVNE